MPLVRFEEKNEYGLGKEELYKEASRDEDPKPLLDGLAVSGLVGILRHLGDLVEFAAEVFHGLQEQVMTTASRSHRLMVRVQNIEAALPPLEKAILAQTSHIHFAYTVGSEWHPRIPKEQNHFIYNDLPRFIMDSYEECRDPPRLHLLDKFDVGGTGSCLKRYSDPTYFRKVSSSLKESDDKVQKVKKSCKSKKKRSMQGNRDSHSASTPAHGDRMHFDPSYVNGRTSPSYTTSTVDWTLKSDVGDQSNSFDFKVGSGYTEHVFHRKPAMQLEEHQSSQVSSRFTEHDDICESAYTEEHRGITDDIFPQSSPQQVDPGSSCVTWDEKLEIIEPGFQHYKGSDITGILGTQLDLDKHDNMDINLRSPDQIDFAYGNDDSPKSSLNGVQIDDVESEPDNYMDALNTIESESENDTDCQKKHEVEQFDSLSNYKALKDQIDNGVSHTLHHCLSEHEAPITSHTSSSVEVSDELDNSVPLEGCECEETSPVFGTSSSSDHLPVTGGYTTSVLEGVILESGISHPSSGSITAKVCEPASENNVSISCNYQESATEISSGTSTKNSPESKVELSGGTSVSKPQESEVERSGGTSAINFQESKAELSGVVTPITIWTNGGLLGLQPSKPPDFARSNLETLDSETRSKGEVSPPNPSSMPRNDGERMRPVRLVDDAGSVDRSPSSSCSASRHIDYDTKIENSTQLLDGLGYGNGDRGLDMVTARVTTQKEMPPNPGVHSATLAHRVNDEGSSRMFGLGHRLLVDGLCRTLSLASDGKSEPANSLRTNALDQNSAQNGSKIQATSRKANNEEFKWNFAIESPSSSPPLGHMKISFHPADGFDASKLKLKFPNGSHGNKSIKDTFPAFQLVPEPMMLLHDIGSASENDTFCRSSPYRSDDCFSHKSDLDSELWESGDSPEHKDHELYDALSRNSSVGIVSSSFLTAEAGSNGIHVEMGPNSVYNENGTNLSLPPSLLDLPSYDSMNAEDDLKAGGFPEQQHVGDYTPLPPPLPPVQWRASKTASDMSEDKDHAISEAPKHALGLPVPAPPQQANSRPVLANRQLTNEQTNSFRWSKNEIKFKQREANQPAIGKGSEEDFLHQIRSKSFSLRRTVTVKPTFGSGPVANDKVIAILRKANAIRQAVGSDDGEADDDDDDTWSDA